MIVLGRHAKEEVQSALRLQCSHFQQETMTNTFYTENYVISRLWSTNKSNIATSDAFALLRSQKNFNYLSDFKPFQLMIT